MHLELKHEIQIDFGSQKIVSSLLSYFLAARID